MTTTFLYQIQDRAMSHEIFTAFKTVYPDAEYNHIKNTITVEMTVDSNPPFMESFYKGIRNEYYRLIDGQDYPQPAAAPGQVQEPRIAHGYFDESYIPFVDWIADSTAAETEDKRDNERIAWDSIPKVHEVEREAEIQNLLIEATEDEVYWHLQDLMSE